MPNSASLMGAIRKDQRARWRDGDAVRVEAYLDQYPSLEFDSAAVLDLVYQELALRQERGETPELPEYLTRFRQFDRQLRALFESPRTMVSDGGSRPSPVDQPSSPTSLDPSNSALLQKTVHSKNDSLIHEGSHAPAPGYEIVRELGRGAMGVVYQARQHSLKRHVALKMLLAGPFAGATTKSRFRTEAEAVARLQHPNIVQIHEVSEHDGRPFLCLEYVDGANLQMRAAESPLSEREAACLVQTLARAVQHTHKQGIVHRDLKPSNILLTSDGVPKITDFGLAKLLDADTGPTRTEAVLGTPNYMSPEQAAGLVKKIGPASDIYALGAILYELLTGRVPFQGTTLLNTLEQVRTREPVPPRKLQSHVSHDLQTICLKCLEKEPAKRYATAAALADDLGRYLDGQPIVARPIPVIERLWRFARRRPAALAGVAAAVCLLVAACWYLGIAGQLSRHRAEEKYQSFLQRRDDAMFYGLVSPEEGTLLSGADAAAHLRSAESAAREALVIADDLANVRQSETATDSYALTLILASVCAQQASLDPDDKTLRRQALQVLDGAGRFGVESRSYHLRRANLLDSLDRPDEARQARARAAALPLKDALDYFLVGEDLYRRGRWQEAEDHFNRALAAQPSHFWAQFFVAVCHLRAERYDSAKAGFNACLAQKPEFVWAYLFRSMANEKLKDRSLAEADLNAALALPLTDDARYVLHQTRGILHFKKRDWPAAAADFRAAQALKPDQYNAYLNLAHVALAERQFDRADDLVAEAMRLNPPADVLAGYHAECGKDHLRDKNYDKAIASSAAALNIAPLLSHALEVRARALLALSRFDQAEAAFDACVRNAKLPSADVFRGRGQARMRLGKYLDAVDDYTQALSRHADADLYHHRGWAHFFADGWKLAYRDFSEALERNPNLGDAYTGRGLASVMLGDAVAAVADATSALERVPDSPEMMHNIACVFALAAARVPANSPDAEVYRFQAIAALDRTLEMLPPEERRSFWRDKISRDTALAAVRNHPEYERLQRDFGPSRP